MADSVRSRKEPAAASPGGSPQTSHTSRFSLTFLFGPGWRRCRPAGDTKRGKENGHAGVNGHTGDNGHALVNGHTAVNGHAGVNVNGHTGVNRHILVNGHAGVNGHTGVTGHTLVNGHTGVNRHTGVNGHTLVNGHAGVNRHTAVFPTEVPPESITGTPGARERLQGTPGGVGNAAFGAQTLRERMGRVVAGLEDVLRGLKEVHLETEEVVRRIDQLTSGMDLTGSVADAPTAGPCRPPPAYPNERKRGTRRRPETDTPPPYPPGGRAWRADRARSWRRVHLSTTV